MTATPLTEQADAIARTMAINVAPAWMPKQGEHITGKVAGFRTYDHAVYGKSPVIVYELADGSFLSVALFSQILRERMFELKPQIGDVVTTAYQGKFDNRKDPDKTYHSYAAALGESLEDTSTVAPW